ncbi:MAG: hypothetical protein KF745_09290 [Phycisphaeraceae bacterium]|nr:hypothetical protein [Phycisphaeraceae bacterium]
MAVRMSRELVAAVCISMIAASGALAQSEPALKGPQVKDREVPGVREQFSDGEQQGKGMRQIRMPMPVFIDALKAIQGDSAPSDIRVSAELEAKIKGEIQKFEADRRAFAVNHRDELRSLRQSSGQGADRPVRRPAAEGDAMNEAPAAGQAPASKERQAAIEKLRELEKSSPKVEDLYTRVWEQLSVPQRQAVDARLDEWRQRAAKEREERYVRERVGRKAPGAAADGGAKPTTPARPGANRPTSPGVAPSRERAVGAESISARRDRLIRAFEQLPVEEQERILDRLEQRRRATRGAGAGTAPTQLRPMD